MPRPTSDLDGCAAAHAAIVERAAELDEATVRAPSALPGWSRAHVLVHIARNADSMSRRLEGAGRGETVDQYPGGVAGRAAEIEAGLALDGAALVADLRASIARLDAAVAAMDDEAWLVDTRAVGGRRQRADDLPALLAERGAGAVDTSGHDDREVLAWRFGRARPAGLPDLGPF